MIETKQGSAQLVLTDRSELHIDGVEDVYAFDESNVHLKTTMGELSVDGEGLRLRDLSLENGGVFIEGKIDGLYYIDRQEKKKHGLFGRKI